MFGVGNDSDGTDEEVGDGFLDVLGERYLWLVRGYLVGIGRD